MSYVAAGYAVTFAALVSYAAWVIRRRSVLSRSVGTAPADVSPDRRT